MPVEAGAILLSAVEVAGSAFARFLGSGETNIQQTNALVWVMIALSAGGAIITFSFLVYSLWKFRDPKMRNRRYG